MPRTRLQEMLSVIKKTNHNRFTDMVNSPYFNKNMRVTWLCNWLLENRREGDGYTKEELISAIEPDESLRPGLTDANFRMVISDFVKLVEEYLWMEEKKKDVLEIKIDLLEIFQNNKLSKSYLLSLKDTEKKQKVIFDKDMTYYYRSYFIECLKLIDGKDGSLQEADEHITNAFICMKLDNMIKAQILEAGNINIGFGKEILKKINFKLNSYKKNHSNIYERQLILQTLLKNNKKTLFTIKSFLKKNKKRLSKKSEIYLNDKIKYLEKIFS